MVNKKILFKIFGPQTASVLLLRNESQERNKFFFKYAFKPTPRRKRKQITF